MTITIEQIIDQYSTYYVVTLCKFGSPMKTVYASTRFEAEYLAEIHG